jgi:glycosyltransferase involved in cell wall biosynthesis
MLKQPDAAGHPAVQMAGVPSPKVSVLMITYNHESFVGQAVRSALNQEVDFPYEIVIGEDCSPDATRSIVERLHRENPEKIRLLKRDRRLGGHQNLIETLSACRAPYVALLEGDDFWTSPHKLRKQVDFLDRHPDCAISFHNVSVLNCDGDTSERVVPGHWKRFSTCEDLLNLNFIPTCSAMFRHGLFPQFPEWIYSLPLCDWILHILNAQHGNIGFIDEVMGCYRLHKGGTFSTVSRLDNLRVRDAVYGYLIDFLPTQYRTLVSKCKVHNLYFMVSESQHLGDRQSVCSYARQLIGSRPLYGDVPRKLAAGLWVTSPRTAARLIQIRNSLKERLR